MVMSVEEQITSLEAEMAKIKGQNAVHKKAEIKRKIDDLKASISDVPKSKTTPGKVSDEDDFILDKRPMPIKWEKVTMEQVIEAENASTLVGFDPKRMLALIRK